MKAGSAAHCFDVSPSLLNLSKNLGLEEFDAYIKWITFAGRRISEGEIRNQDEMKREFVEYMYVEYNRDIDIALL